MTHAKYNYRKKKEPWINNNNRFEIPLKTEIKTEEDVTKLGSLFLEAICQDF